MPNMLRKTKNFAEYHRHDEENSDLFSLSPPLWVSRSWWQSDYLRQVCDDVRHPHPSTEIELCSLRSSSGKKKPGNRTLDSRLSKSTFELNWFSLTDDSFISLPSSSPRICECSRRCVTECLSLIGVRVIISITYRRRRRGINALKSKSSE